MCVWSDPFVALSKTRKNWEFPISTHSTVSHTHTHTLAFACACVCLIDWLSNKATKTHRETDCARPFVLFIVVTVSSPSLLSTSFLRSFVGKSVHIFNKAYACDRARNMHAYPFVCVCICVLVYVLWGEYDKMCNKRKRFIGWENIFISERKNENFILLQTYSNLKVCTHWLLLIVGSHRVGTLFQDVSSILYSDLTCWYARNLYRREKKTDYIKSTVSPRLAPT